MRRVGQLVGMLVVNTLGTEDGLTVGEVVGIDVDSMVDSGQMISVGLISQQP